MRYAVGCTEVRKQQTTRDSVGGAQQSLLRYKSGQSLGPRDDITPIVDIFDRRCPFDGIFQSGLLRILSWFTISSRCVKSLTLCKFIERAEWRLALPKHCDFKTTNGIWPLHRRLQPRRPLSDGLL